MEKFALRYLRYVSRLWGIQPSYTNIEGNTVWAAPESLQFLLTSLSGRASQTTEDLASLEETAHRDRVDRQIPQSLVAWGGRMNPFSLCLGEANLGQKIEFALNGKTLAHQATPFRRHGAGYDLCQIQITDSLPLGYHHLELKLNDQAVARSFVISAPSEIPSPAKKSWGPFIPIYSLRSANDWGIGSIKDLKAAAEICAQYGAKWVSVLPLLAGRFEGEDPDPSPYSSVTRFFWNEIYLDVPDLLKRYPSREAQSLVESSAIQDKIKYLRSLEYVNYGQVFALKKQVLTIMARDFFAAGASQKYRDYQKANPLLESYVKFRATKELEQNYHRFVQFAMFETLSEFQATSPCPMYMDFPVGVNDGGFDFAYFRENFFAPVSVGAPPEPVFQLGQDWGFPAFHPIQIRNNEYGYFIESIRAHLKFSRILRIDHAMGLYRIYAVPKGFGGKRGVYLRFPSQDFFAIVALEASQAGADIIAENLGTVPVAVNELLKAHNFKTMRIIQLEVDQDAKKCLSSLAPGELVSLNTHDMPEFATFLAGEDLDQVRDLKILAENFHGPMKAQRKASVARWAKDLGEPLIDSCLSALAESPADYLVVNLEDLWGETRPQNIPGTWKEVPNWRRKMAKTISEWSQDRKVVEHLDSLHKHRP